MSSINELNSEFAEAYPSPGLHLAMQSDLSRGEVHRPCGIQVNYRVCWRMKSVIKPSASTDAALVGFCGMKVCGCPSNFRSVILPPALV